MSEKEDRELAEFKAEMDLYYRTAKQVQRDERWRGVAYLVWGILIVLGIPMICARLFYVG